MTQTTHVAPGTAVIVHSLGGYYRDERATVVGVELTFAPTQAHLVVRFESGVERWVEFELCDLA